MCIITNNYVNYILMENYLSDSDGIISGSLPFPEKSPLAGSFLLKNGRISTVPIINQTFGIMVDDNLCIPLSSIKGRRTAQQAENLFKKFHCAIPTVYKSMRLYQAFFDVYRALKRLNINGFFPLFNTDFIWDCESLKAFSFIEKRDFVLILPVKQKEEPLCQRIAPEIILFDNKEILLCYNGNILPAKPAKTLRFGKISLIAVRLGEDCYLFYRNDQNKVYYIGCNEKIKVLDQDLLVIGKTIYQVYNDCLLKIATVESETIFLQHGNRLITGEIFRHPDKQYRPIVCSSFYKKDERGVYKFDRKKLSFM